MLGHPEGGDKEELYKMLNEIKCINCKQNYIPKNKKQKFCCLNCKKEYYKKYLFYSYKCSYCGKEYKTHWFHNGKNKEYFCSKRCEILFRRNNGGLYIIKHCEICGKEIIITRKDRLTQRFCGTKCQSLWQSLTLVGDNSNYKKFLKQMTKRKICDNCFLEFKSRVKKPKKFNFCSEKCKEEYISKTLISDEECQVLGNLSSRKSKTEPQRIADSIMQKLGIAYVNEHKIGTYWIDTYVPTNKTCIEIMGSYWHGDSRFYSKKELNEVQVRVMTRDKTKQEYLLSLGYKIIYLWEYDIITNPPLCEHILKEYLQKDKIFSVIHSSNFILSLNKGKTIQFIEK